LRKLNGNASSANLEQIQEDIAASIPRCPYSLQRHELADFFDTDANLSLGFTDVSPFVRGLDEDTDLQVCWREAWSEDGGPPDFSPDYQRDELCSVPISKWRYDVKAREVLNRGWLWRGKESGWISVRDAGLAPGMTILLPLLAGGYDNAAGWTGDKADNKHSSHYEPGDETSDEEQLSCLANGWRTIAAHTAEVASELDALLRHLLAAAENEQERNALIVAVPWHDIGKNHPGWQQAVLSALEKAGLSGKDAFRPFAKFSLSEMCSSRPNTAACSIRCSRNSPTLAARNRFATRRYARQSQHQTSPAGVCLPAGEKSPPPAAMFFAPFPARTISALPICGRAGPPISPRIHRTLRRTWWTRSFPPK
jgi:CRISPR-associated endonuclease/helicase Cas3